MTILPLQIHRETEFHLRSTEIRNGVVRISEVLEGQFSRGGIVLLEDMTTSLGSGRCGQPSYYVEFAILRNKLVVCTIEIYLVIQHLQEQAAQLKTYSSHIRQMHMDSHSQDSRV